MMRRPPLVTLLLVPAFLLSLACSQTPAPAAPEAPTAPAAPAPASAEPTQHAASDLPATGKVFVCPMTECNEVMAGPGKCSKCGMDLVETDRANLSWVCPMKECNEVKSEPGKCSKCGMDLALKVKAQEPAKP